ncbi:MAG TPA: tetratricopeptide repeat protein [Streptosporangiaceae bacterium]
MPSNAAAQSGRRASRTQVENPDEPTIVVPRPSSDPPEPPVEVRAPAQAEPEVTGSAVKEPSGGEPEVVTEAEEPADGKRAGAIPGEPPGFVSRADLLAELDRSDAQVLALHSVPGAGATQLAAAYARARLAEGWRLVAWVSAADTATLLGGLAAVADALGLSEPAATQNRTDPGQIVRRWLEADGHRCLLVLDDVTDPETVRPFIPAGGAARVVITSHQESDLGLPVPVGVFSAAEALAFLAGRTGLADDAAAGAVAGELGHLPLALALAASVITRGDLGYAGYLDRLRALPSGEELPGAERAVRLALDAVPVGVRHQAMRLIAVLSTAGVRRDLLHAAGKAGLLGGGRQTTAEVDAALDKLAGLSLLTISLDGQIVIAEGLVVRAVRDGLSRRQLADVCRGAASLLEALARSLASSSDRLAVRDVTEQVTALAEAASPASPADPELTRVLLRLRFLALYHLIELGDSAVQAVTVGELLTADLDRLLGPEHPDTLNARNSLAAAYQAAGRPADAIRLFEQILVVRERLLGPEHPDTLTTQNNLATAYKDAGRAGEARLMFELTLAAKERLLGSHHPSTLNSRGNLAAAYRDTGRAAEAIELFEQTLAGREKVLGADHPDTVHSRVNLAAAYRDAGRVTDAIPLVERILSARERELGSNHPSTLNSRINLAAAYREAGRATEAIPLVEQTLAACERQLGAEHPRTMSARNNLANAYRDVGRTEEAIVLHEQTLAACMRQLGAEHPRTLGSRSNLAASYQEGGRVDEAIRLYEQTLADRERLLGTEHPSTLNSRHHLAAAYRDAGRAGEAIRLLEQTLEARERVLGRDHPDTVATRNLLAPGQENAGPAAQD